MKGKRWFFILLLFLLLINIAVFIIFRFTNYEEFVVDRVTDYLYANYDIELSIGAIDISDRQLKVTAIEVLDQDDRYQLSIDQLYLNYNLFKVIFSNFRLFRAFESITIIEPHLQVSAKSAETDDTSSEPSSFKDVLDSIVLPDFWDYFVKLNVTGGRFDILYENERLVYKESFYPVTIAIDNSQDTEVSVKVGESGKTEQDEAALAGEKPSMMDVSIGFKDRHLNEINLGLEEYSPATLLYHSIDDIGFKLSVQGSYKRGNISLDGKLNELELSVNDYPMGAGSIVFYTEGNNLYIDSDDAGIDANMSKLSFILTDYLSTNPSVSGAVSLPDIDVSKYVGQAEGSLEAEIDFQGRLVRPDIRATLSSDKLSAYQEVFHNLKVSASYFDDMIPIALESLVWQGNEMSGEGLITPDEGLKLSVTHKDLELVRDDIRIMTDLEVKFTYHDLLNIEAVMADTAVENEIFAVKDLGLTLGVKGGVITADIDGQGLQARLEGDIDRHIYELGLDLQRFKLDDVLAYRIPIVKVYPLLSGNLNLEYREKQINLSHEISMSNIHAGNLEGVLTGELFYDTAADSGSFKVHTTDASINFEPFSISLFASISDDKISAERFTINDEVDIGFEWNWLEFAGQGYRFSELDPFLSINAEQISISRYLRYLMSYHTAVRFAGTADIQAQYDGSLQADVKGSEISYDGFGGFFYEASLSSTAAEDVSKVKMESILSTQENVPFIYFTGETALKKGLNTELSARISDFSLAELHVGNSLKGVIDADFHFSLEQGQTLAELDFSAARVEYDTYFDIDNLDFRAVQSDSLFSVERFSARTDGLFSITAEGGLGYNIFRRHAYYEDGEILVKYEGDILRQLSNSLDFLVRGRSSTEAEFSISILDEELSFTHGRFRLSDGELQIINQPMPLEDVEMAFSIRDNALELTNCRGKMGEGRFIIRNEIFDDGNDFMFGMLNLGRYYLTTGSTGLSVHLPNMMPQGTTGNVVVKGRDGDEGQVTGPFDDIKLAGELYVSNAAFTYPPQTENLFKVINIAAERRARRTRRSPLPFTLDLMLIADQQVRYITYPLNLLVNPEGYLHLLYENGEWIPSEAFLDSDSGSLDFFGTTFNADYANLIINHSLDDYRLRGYFYRYAADGSNITLSVYNDADVGKDNFLNNLNFSIESDNPEDRTILHVLSKLRYNRRLEDIPRSQQNALLQDEFLQFTGMGLSGAFVDPLISPIENRIRRFLNLDFFSINPGFMENIVRTYGYSEREYEFEEQNELVLFGKNILLNNLSVNMGKFLARDMYLDYEFLVQRPVDVVGADELLVYQSFTYHYNLPYRLRLAYRFYLKPKEEENSHEIFVRRAFSFW